MSQDIELYWVTFGYPTHDPHKHIVRLCVRAARETPKQIKLKSGAFPNNGRVLVKRDNGAYVLPVGSWTLLKYDGGASVARTDGAAFASALEHIDRVHARLVNALAELEDQREALVKFIERYEAGDATRYPTGYLIDEDGVYDE